MDRMGPSPASPDSNSRRTARPFRGSAICWMFLRFISTSLPESAISTPGTTLLNWLVARLPSHLDARYDFIELVGGSATEKLMVLEWNDVILYPAGTPAQQLTYDAKLLMPDGWKFGTPLDRKSTRLNSSHA